MPLHGGQTVLFHLTAVSGKFGSNKLFRYLFGSSQGKHFFGCGAHGAGHDLHTGIFTGFFLSMALNYIIIYFFRIIFKLI